MSPTVTDRPVARRPARRRVRNSAQGTLWRESNMKRVAFCGRFPSDRTGVVTLKLTGTPGTPEARAGFGGLQTCGSTWACPVCSESIQAVRQAEVAGAIETWQVGGGSVLFGTLTLRHNRGHGLAELWDAIGPAWNRTTSGAGVAWDGSKKVGGEVGDRARFGIAGIIRLVETKVGVNGWHPHIHFLIFTEDALQAAGVRDLEGRLFGRWEAALAKKGLSVLRSVGIDLRPVTVGDGGLGDYFAKATYRADETTAAAAAYEVTGSVTKRAGKGGRTPFDLLSDVVEHGDADALDLWHEWERASLGRRQLTWSHGFRARLAEMAAAQASAAAALLAEERTDEQIVEDDSLAGTVVYSWGREAWNLGGWAYRKSDLLEAAEEGTLRQLLARRGEPPG